MQHHENQIKFFIIFLVTFSLLINVSYAQSYQGVVKTKAEDGLIKNSKNLKSASIKTGSLFSSWSATKILTLAVLGSAVAIGGASAGGGGSDENDNGSDDEVITPQQEFNNQYGLGNINADDAYSRGYPNNNIIVAVVDSGVDLDHPDLAANIYSNGRDFANNDFNANSDGFSSHGTHVAGIIAATKNGAGMYGVAYQAKILPIKITYSSYIQNSTNVPFVSYDNIALGVDYAVNNGAKIINNSWGSDIKNQNLVNKYDNILTGGNGDGIVDIMDFKDNGLADQSNRERLNKFFSNNSIDQSPADPKLLNSFINAKNQEVVVIFAAGNDMQHSQTSLEGSIPELVTELKNHWGVLLR